MKKSEKLLLGIFAALLLLMIGGGGVLFAYRNYAEIKDEVSQLGDQLENMRSQVASGEKWAARQSWLDDNIPGFASRQEASAKLLEAVQKEAETASVSLLGREILETTQALGPDGLPLDEAEQLNAFDRAAVKVTLNGVKEEDFYRWLHALQKPKSFIGITRLQINPSSKSINAEVEFTQFYRQQQAPKVTKAN
ncbi:MAG: hypothetical protein IPK32_15390 [Verrucomicrobiaceae bacterium]|nr:hypothetical protein [Verrucomicrobiaceae bacterium]